MIEDKFIKNEENKEGIIRLVINERDQIKQENAKRQKEHPNHQHKETRNLPYPLRGARRREGGEGRERGP